MTNVTATYVKNHIADCWAMAQQEPVWVESAGKEIAVILSPDQFRQLSARRPRQAGCGAHLLEGVDIDALLATPIPGIEEYMP